MRSSALRRYPTARMSRYLGICGASCLWYRTVTGCDGCAPGGTERSHGRGESVVESISWSTAHRRQTWPYTAASVSLTWTLRHVTAAHWPGRQHRRLRQGILTHRIRRRVAPHGTVRRQIRRESGDIRRRAVPRRAGYGLKEP